jgi:hypothetical protein
MRRAAAILLLGSIAHAAPAADIVVVWAPGLDAAPIAKAALARGAAMIDRSPAIAEPPSIDATIQRGIDAYDSLKLDAAWFAFEEARMQLDASGGARVTSARLSDLFVYRSLVRAQQGNNDGAWDEIVEAVVVAPTRVFDPGRFPPRVLADLDRARAASAATRVTVAFDAPAECELAIDGVPLATREVPLLRGAHWAHARCPDRAPWGKRIDVGDGTARVAIAPAALVPPSETDLLVQARTAGTRGMLVVEVHGTIARVRLLGVDGVERDRRTVAIERSLAPAVAVVDAMLAPRATRHWYDSKWTWAAGGAIAFAAILIPTILILRDDAPTGAQVVGPKDVR